MAVLAVLEGLVTVRANGLLWTSVHASETHGAVVTDGSDKTALRADRRQTILRTDRTQTYVLHWANANAGVTADTFVGVHFRAQGANHAFFYSRQAQQPREDAKPTVMQRVTFGLQFADDFVQAILHTLKLPKLFVRVASKCEGAVIRHTNLVAVCEYYTLLAQQMPQCPNTVTCLSAASNHGKDVCFWADTQLWHECSNNRRKVEIVGREDETDALFA